MSVRSQIMVHSLAMVRILSIACKIFFEVILLLMLRSKDYITGDTKGWPSPCLFYLSATRRHELVTPTDVK